MATIKEVKEKVSYIISVSESVHPADTQSRKIELMVGHAKSILADLEEFDKSVGLKPSPNCCCDIVELHQNSDYVVCRCCGHRGPYNAWNKQKLEER